MARYVDVPNELKITSEEIEPALLRMIGKLFAQSEYIKEQHGKNSIEYADALEALWEGAEAATSLASAAIDATHALLLCSRHERQIDSMVEAELGFSPILSPDKPFRSYVD